MASRAEFAADWASGRRGCRAACLPSAARRLWRRRRPGVGAPGLSRSCRADRGQHRLQQRPAAHAQTRRASVQSQPGTLVVCLVRSNRLAYSKYILSPIMSNGSRKDVRVNVIESWEVGPDKVQHCSWVTDLRVHQRNVYTLMRGGRARWKIENETFNTLKNQGYNFEHNYGHGEKNLSVVFAMLMMLAFLVDQTQQLCCDLFRAVWAKLGSKRQLWESMRSLFYTYALPSMRQLLEALFYGLKRPIPIFAIDTS